jgi:hypothetical protein
VTRRKRDVLPLSLPPRGLSRVEAAAYIGVSVTFFDQLVDDGRMPHPKLINTRKVWDRLSLDRAFEALPTDGDENEWDEPAIIFREDGRPVEAKSPAKAKGNDRVQQALEQARELASMTPTELAEYWRERQMKWAEEVRKKPLNRREVAALLILGPRGNDVVRIWSMKGTGVATMDRLEARLNQCQARCPIIK